MYIFSSALKRAKHPIIRTKAMERKQNETKIVKLLAITILIKNKNGATMRSTLRQGIQI
jgi:hypothetical protein